LSPFSHILLNLFSLDHLRCVLPPDSPTRAHSHATIHILIFHRLALFRLPSDPDFTQPRLNPPPLQKKKKKKEQQKRTTPHDKPNMFGKAEKCQTCGKNVYRMERLACDEKVFHKWCLRCSKCERVLNAGNYASMQGEYWCKPCYKKMFKLKGNYDEGFGREQHKKKWANQTYGGGVSPSASPSSSPSAKSPSPAAVHASSHSAAPSGPASSSSAAQRANEKLADEEQKRAEAAEKAAAEKAAELERMRKAAEANRAGAREEEYDPKKELAAASASATASSPASAPAPEKTAGPSALERQNSAQLEANAKLAELEAQKKKAAEDAENARVAELERMRLAAEERRRKDLEEEERRQAEADERQRKIREQMAADAEKRRLEEQAYLQSQEGDLGDAEAKAAAIEKARAEAQAKAAAAKAAEEERMRKAAEERRRKDAEDEANRLADVEKRAAAARASSCTATDPAPSPAPAAAPAVTVAAPKSASLLAVQATPPRASTPQPQRHVAALEAVRPSTPQPERRIGGAPKCEVCSKSVFPMEKLVVDGNVFHKVCFKCHDCKRTLGTGNYAANAGIFYCKNCLLRAFKTKGNYDEGFGRDQHKKKWSGAIRY